MVTREQIAELRQRARLMQEELESATGPIVRAKVERGGGAVIAAVPQNEDGRGFYSVQARLSGGAEVIVYVPDNISLIDGAAIEVVEGQFGHYFRTVVTRE